MNEAAKTLAIACATAEKIYEDSYDLDAALAIDGPTDYARFYRKTVEQAAYEGAVQAGCPELWYPVYLLTKGYWNDAQSWAQAVVEGRVGVEYPQPVRGGV